MCNVGYMWVVLFFNWCEPDGIVTVKIFILVEMPTFNSIMTAMCESVSF